MNKIAQKIINLCRNRIFKGAINNKSAGLSVVSTEFRTVSLRIFFIFLNKCVNLSSWNLHKNTKIGK